MMPLLLPLVLLAFPVPPEETLVQRAKRVAALIEALGDPDIAVRRRSHAELQRMALWIEDALRQNLKHPDAEVATRCRDLLASLTPPKRLPGPAAGKIALSDPKRGRIAVDVRARDGVQPGDRFEVLRLGERVGGVVVVEVQTWGSWVQPEGGVPVETFLKGDSLYPADR
jgi:hypothetical protein